MIHGKMLFLNPTKESLTGKLAVPGDKSISHRSLMFGALAEGQTEIRGLLESGDVLATLSAIKQTGTMIKRRAVGHYLVEGTALKNFSIPTKPIDLGNSGTSARLLSGLFAKQVGPLTLIGDQSLSKRPMKRISKPLTQMGLDLQGDTLPLVLANPHQQLQSITYQMEVASAQVKSAIMLAAIQAEGITTIIDPIPSRDHTEKMLQDFSGEVTRVGQELLVPGNQSLKATTVDVPGDFSSAAFWLVAGILLPNSELTIEKVGLNATRTGLLTAFDQMGLHYDLELIEDGSQEPRGNVTVKAQKGTGTVIEGALLPRLIDEIPILALLATQVNGETVIKDAQELRVKETDRIQAVVSNLQAMGATIEATDDGMRILGPTPLKGAVVDSYGDHRIAMMLVIASLIAEGETRLLDAFVMKISYPNFLEDLKILLHHNQ
ncbi:3-phosphoshikimate 1-carboxyvinyltransferase [Isobaculum melis]|uniref:3-phosphoshikimate 1-carboxyvinyltransferase n=1 Tax=Isobaculum melis TaxID=142588 RepID=A0A1H9R8N2_9LACT|nr:3-phosphoshikimate 1-carboxyvinyltransferase [Isobaculum melis]SER68957.1 3-phosphoshikimate 1-carboxyvinyltransferase [Isobaculum melis]